LRLLQLVAFSKKLPWFEPTKAISLKTQPHAVNACVKRSSQRSFNEPNSISVAFRNFIFYQKFVTWKCQTLFAYPKTIHQSGFGTFHRFISILKNGSNSNFKLPLKVELSAKKVLMLELKKP